MSSKKKAAKNRARRKKDPAMGPLLDLLKARPELVHALVFDHAKVERLLKSRAARQLVPGVDARKMLLKSVTGGVPAGGPAPGCYTGTLLPPSNTGIPLVLNKAGLSIQAYCIRGTYLFCGQPRW
jgi:hypothetical protein